MAYIIDSYSKYDVWDRKHSVYKFEVNENWYAIKEVEMDWGLPLLPERMDEHGDKDRRIMHVYDTKEEAFMFA